MPATAAQITCITRPFESEVSWRRRFAINWPPISSFEFGTSSWTASRLKRGGGRQPPKTCPPDDMNLDSLRLEIAASTASGCASTILGHPLDCIKVRLQAQQAPLSTAACAVQMLRQQGTRAFTAGIGPPLINSVLMNSVMFLAFSESRKHLPLGVAGAVLAGAFSGVVTAVLSTPFDLVKIQSQLGRSRSRHVLLDLLRHDPRRLYTGHTINLLREGVFTALYLGLYDVMRSALLDNTASAGPPPLPLVALASSLTGAVAWVGSYPFDIIKSIQQAQPLSTPSSERRSATAVARALWSAGGAQAFYRGVSASTARAVLVTCSRLVTYEYVKQTV